MAVVGLIKTSPVRKRLDTDLGAKTVGAIDDETRRVSAIGEVSKHANVTQSAIGCTLL